MPKTQWRHYAENRVAPICRKSNGSLTPKDDSRSETENARLKKLLAERDLEIEVMKEINGIKWWARLRVGAKLDTRMDAAYRSDEHAR